MALGEKQNKIEGKFRRRVDFLPYIEEIRFPMFKSLEDNLVLPLDWPIVALVGPNGTNKSSVLQAISAAPEGRSLAAFWFSTEVDDINKGPREGSDHRFIYKYRFDQSGVVAECRKYRGSKLYRSSDVPRALKGQRDPDYWEPTKRVAKDGMAIIPTSGYDSRLSKNRDRWNQIQKPVVYLDFRSELSAFDKYIHHQSFDRWASDATKKRYKVVTRSKWIAQALAGESLPQLQEKLLIQRVRYLDVSDVAIIAKILGKPIVKVAMIEHRFFGPTGYTVRLYLQKSVLSDRETAYSEAHAGSGEYAVVRLVDAFRRAQERSLILLDEPEVSLHPGAQIQLLNFIESEVLIHGHQVVLSTHSPSLAAGLPKQAIKVFGFDATRQRVVLVANGCSPTEAFAHLGQATTSSTTPRLIVEDELAAEIVKASLRRHARTKLDSLNIVSFPGGADGVVKNVLPTFALMTDTKVGILLDGDQRPLTFVPKFDMVDALSRAISKSDLDVLWKEQFHRTSPNLFSNSDGGRDKEILRSCIAWSNGHLDYLPGSTPEEALALASRAVTAEPANGWKGYWLELVRKNMRLTNQEEVTAGEVLAYQRNILAQLDDQCSLFLDVAEIVERIIQW